MQKLLSQNTHSITHDPSTHADHICCTCKMSKKRKRSADTKDTGDDAGDDDNLNVRTGSKLGDYTIGKRLSKEGGLSCDVFAASKAGDAKGSHKYAVKVPRLLWEEK